MSPRFGSQLGGTPVQVRGPCFNPSDTVKCYFDTLTIPIPGIYESQDRYICVTPFLNKYGRVQVRVEVTDINGVTILYYGYFTSSM